MKIKTTIITLYEFDYKGFLCTIQNDEHGFWASACDKKDIDKEISHMFPEKTLEESIKEIKRSVKNLCKITSN